MSVEVVSRRTMPASVSGAMRGMLRLDVLLSVVAVIVLGCIGVVAWVDQNYGGDAFMYHLPFAARMFGIVPADVYGFEADTTARWHGFPKLAEFLQGLLWFTTGRAEATNMLCFSSLIVLIVFLRQALRIPFYLGALSLLAVPMIHMHAAKSYIDLFGNTAVSILILSVFFFYTGRFRPSGRMLSCVCVAAAVAANTKHQLAPIVLLSLGFLFIRLVWQRRMAKSGHWGRFMLAAVAILLLIFATQTKNTIAYGNPFYPVQVKIAGYSLPFNEIQPSFMHADLRALPAPVRWGKSLLEIGAFDDRRPWRWTLAMDCISWDEPTFGVGGYFAPYVVFNLLLFAYLAIRIRSRETALAAGLLIILSGFTSVLPQSYELRYYMYWIIVLLAFNGYFVCQWAARYRSGMRLVTPQGYALVATGFMTAFIVLTNGFYDRPQFVSFKDVIREWTKPDVLTALHDGDRVCLESGVSPFLYNSVFHPPHHYYIRAEWKVPTESKPGGFCDGLPILRGP